MTTKLPRSSAEHALAQYRLDEQRLLEFQMSGRLYQEIVAAEGDLMRKLHSLLNDEEV